MTHTEARSAQYQDSHAGGSVEVFCYGDYFPGEIGPDWTLRHLVTPESPIENENATIIRRLPEIGRAIGVKNFVAPSPIEFCGRIAKPDDLATEISWGGITVRRGVTADGCIIPSGEGYILSAAGCAAIIARRRSDGEVIAAHAGLRSLDRAPEAGHVEFQSVVVSIVEVLGTDLDVWVTLPIDPEQFTYPPDHPSFGRINEQRRFLLHASYTKDAVPGPQAEGRVDIRVIIKHQFKVAGVDTKRITIGPSTKEVPGFYTTRDEPPRNTKRNLILVVKRD